MNRNYLKSLVAILLSTSCKSDPGSNAPPQEDSGPRVQPTKVEQAPKKPFELKLEHLGQDGFPPEEILKKLPEKERARWERDRQQKLGAEKYLGRKLPPQDSETHIKSANECVAPPQGWSSGNLKRPPSCRHCTSPPPRIPKCAPTLRAERFGAEQLAAAAEPVTIRGAFTLGVVQWVGTAERAHYSASLIFQGRDPEAKMLLFLGDEELQSPLSKLRQGQWFGALGSLNCGGQDEVCCPLDLWPAGMESEFAVTGTVLELDEHFPGERSGAQAALLARSICRLSP